MAEQREEHVASSEDLKMCNNDHKFLNKIITGDKLWCFAYDSESKCQSVTWVGLGLPQAKKLQFQKSRIKIIVDHIIRFYWHYP